MKVSRHLHLMGATGAIRTASFHGREHVVVPVVALVEGVIFPVNAETPELVLASEFSTAPQGWNGRPVVAGHPAVNGVQISANSPTVLEARSFGTIFNTEIKNKRLCMEAWLDPVKAKQVGPDAERVVERALAGEPIEVSVGVFVMAENKSGVYHDKSYKAVWHEIVPDHLAMLQEGVLGACSNAMGCGVRTAQVHYVTAEGVEVMEKRSLSERLRALLPSFKDEAVKEIETAALEALGGPGSGNFGHSGRPGEVGGSGGGGGSDKVTVKDTPIHEIYKETLGEEDAALFKNDPVGAVVSGPKGTLQVTGGAYGNHWTLGDRRNPNDFIGPDLLEKGSHEIAWKTKAEAVEWAKKIVSGEVPHPHQKNIDRREKSGANDRYKRVVEKLKGRNAELQDLAGKRHSASDEELIQAMHDKSVDLGAYCAKEKTLADRFAQAFQFEALTANLDPKILEGADKDEHPFTYCQEVVIPAIEKDKGEAVDDPEAFCGWWKAQRINQASVKAASLKAAEEHKCACGGHRSAEGDQNMDKKERVKALIDNPATLFTAEDAAMLEALPDARLTAMEGQIAESQKKAEAKAAEDKAVAEAKAAEAAKLAAAAAKPKTEAEWLADAPESLRKMVTRAAQQEATQKAELVSALKTAQSEYAEDELQAMPIEQLQRLSRIARIAEPAPVAIDFGARVPRVASEDQSVPPPPDMNAAVRALRAKGTDSVQ